MATIDIRATVTCSLGTLISGSLSDDYIQGTGLVKTRGSCELKGILTPAVGTVVTFSYTRDGNTKKVPRKLRVLSSFADPFRQITKVQLGCKLTYMENVSAAPTVDGEAAETSGRQQQCLNGYIDYPPNGNVPIPVSAAGVMDTCLTKLGLTASSNPLTNRFNDDTFDLSAGYVSVLSDLLQSEGYFGYLDQNEKLQICDLTDDSGKGPVITGADVVDIDAIGVGELPGEAVVVRYNSSKLVKPIDPDDDPENDRLSWEYEETVGSPERVEVRYTTANGQSSSAYYTYVPYTKTTTQYGIDQSFGNDVCVIFGRERPDLSNSVLKRETLNRTILADAANNYCSQVLAAGLSVNGSLEGTIRTVEEYIYDAKGMLERQVTSQYQPKFMWAGGLGIEFVYANGAVQSSVPLGNEEVLVERVVRDYETIFKKKPGSVSLKPGETYQPAVHTQKQTVATYRNWTLTLGGQQGTASIRDVAPFESVAQCNVWLAGSAQRLVLVDVQVSTQTNRGEAGQVRAPQALRVGQENGISVESTAELAYAMGSPSSERFVSFSMPYQSDDSYAANGTIQSGDAEAKALRYGRIQNRLLLGNRNGVNLQLHPSKLPAKPFDAFYLSDGSLMVQYRANGLNWAFSSEGIVTSVDALFWGVAGGTGTSWVPVAPGITTFPALPAVADTTPDEVIGTVASIGSTPQTQLDTAFPAAVAGDGVQDLSNEDYWVYDGISWSNEGPNPGPSASVPAVVPPWNELVPFDGVTRTTALVVDYTYPLGSVGTEAVALVTRTSFTVGSVLAAAAGTLSVAGQASIGRYVRGIAGSVGSFAVTGRSAGNVRSYAIGTNAGTFSSTGQAAGLLLQRQPLAASLGSVALTGQDAQFFKGTSMTAAAGVIALAGEAAALSASRILTAAASSYAVSGQAAGLAYTAPQMATALYTGNGSTNTISGLAFQPGLVWLKRRTATTANHWVFDHVRGTTKAWHTNLSSTGTTSATSLTAFNASGFTLGSEAAVNTNSALYVAWCWAKGGTPSTNTDGSVTTTCSVNTNAGYSVFTFTGVDGAQTMGHGLGVTPDLLIVKSIDTSSVSAYVGAPAIGTGKYLSLTSTSGTPTSNTGVYSSITSSVFGGNTVNAFSRVGTQCVGYAFASKAGVSKISTFVGTGAATQAVTGLGFTPRWILVKSISSATSGWQIFDNQRDAILYANTTAVEATPSYITFDSDGFTLSSSAGVNTNGATYLFMAYA
jgi:hypothetical protein